MFVGKKLLVLLRLVWVRSVLQKCKRCFENGLEPYWLVVATIVMIGGLDNAAEWLKELVKITLEFKGITMEKFIDDVQELIDASKGGQHDV